MNLYTFDHKILLILNSVFFIYRDKLIIQNNNSEYQIPERVNKTT